MNAFAPPGTGSETGSLRAWAGLSAAVLLLSAVPGLHAADSPDPAPRDDVVTLPKVTVEAESARNYPFFKRTEVVPPGFSNTAHPIDLFYPGKAYVDEVSEGSATVGVMLDAEGRATDYLVLRYTRKYFGDALLREAREQRYAPRRVRGVAVPGRFDFGYRFVPTVVMQMSGFGAIEQRYADVQGGPRYLYAPHLEREVDGGALEGTKSAVAFVPDGYAQAPGSPIRVLVSFYVDERGRVRLPSVESAPSPVLIPNAIQAVEHWEFKPPTIHGEPVLVFTTWAVKFVAFADNKPPSAAPGPR